METFELLANPARLRIVHALRGDRTLTTGELCARLPDTSKATVYRHVDTLTAAGVLEVAEERRVRGAVERLYRLRQDKASIPAEAAAELPADAYRSVFAVAMAVLMAEFNGYLDGEKADPAADLVGFRQHALWLNRAELEQMIAELRAVIAPRLANQAEPGRDQYLLSPIIFPIERPR
ncbi:helix-turn-helix domain-containing protein [Nocardia sp. CDC153]|uniref:helix-turn-helix domain-containing protein n=1 Tax=Nocardia sp. CDC153 TaxID=3112167 RepID=UPI002DBC169B|nr:helix-turn-helix domain-containing protein [Nocardia sp. CDC153]MEC3954395.1 helix-turn-helix domain-containing protein [Nocardia sp. CDC153]